MKQRINFNKLVKTLLEAKKDIFKLLKDSDNVFLSYEDNKKIISVEIKIKEVKDERENDTRESN